MKKLINFDNPRKEKVPYYDQLISVITEENTIESGWTNGRELHQISEDFGIQNVNWFWLLRSADKYLKEKIAREKNENI